MVVLSIINRFALSDNTIFKDYTHVIQYIIKANKLFIICTKYFIYQQW